MYMPMQGMAGGMPGYGGFQMPGYGYMAPSDGLQPVPHALGMMAPPGGPGMYGINPRCCSAVTSTAAVLARLSMSLSWAGSCWGCVNAACYGQSAAQAACSEYKLLCFHLGSCQAPVHLG